jgi:hypothetical protein
MKFTLSSTLVALALLTGTALAIPAAPAPDTLHPCVPDSCPSGIPFAFMAGQSCFTSDYLDVITCSAEIVAIDAAGNLIDVGDLGYPPASIRGSTPPEFCNAYAADFNINNIVTLTLQDVTYSLTLYECIPSATLEAAIGAVAHGIFEA